MWRLSGFADEIDPDLGVQAETLLALGIGHLEFRAAWGKNILALDDEEIDRAGRLLGEAGIAVSSIASPVGKSGITEPFEPHREAFARALEVAGRLGAPFIRIFSFYIPAGDDPADHREAVLERMGALVAQARGRGVTLLHENEKGIYGDTPARCHDLLATIDDPILRAAWDPANFVQVGVTPFDEGWEALRPYVDYLHVKDARLGTGEVTVAGAGDGQWRETLAALRADGWQGFCSLEPHLATAGERSGFSGPALFHQATEAFVALLDEHDITHDAHPSAAGVIESPGPGQPRGGR